MKSILIALALLVSYVPAHADLLLEPYVGYYFGESDDGTDKDDVTGPGYGARIGYQSLGFMVGGDFMTGSWEADSTPKTDITPTMMGVFAGYNFPILLRVYGVYNITTKSKTESSGSSFDLEGESIKLGVGTTVLPFVSVNFEYITATFDEADGQTLTPSIKHKMYGLSVSLPLTF